MNNAQAPNNKTDSLARYTSMCACVRVRVSVCVQKVFSEEGSKLGPFDHGFRAWFL